MKNNNNEIPKNEPPRPFPKYLPWSFEGHYQPWYDDRRDYNTNAPTYYDYLAHQKFLSDEAIELINRNARRNFYVTDTNSIDLTKKGDWVDNENPCTGKDWQPTQRERYYYDDIVEIVADLKVSKQTAPVTIAGMTQTCPNVLRVLSDGAYVPDYASFIADLRNRLSSAEGEINRLNNRAYSQTETNTFKPAITGNLNNGQTLNFKGDVKKSEKTVDKTYFYFNTAGQAIAYKKYTAPNDLVIFPDGLYCPDNTQIFTQLATDVKSAKEENEKLRTALQKIVTNLYQSGAITSQDVNNFNFNNDTYIANGNINIYAMQANSGTLIKTHATNNNKTGDIVVGLNQEAPNAEVGD